MRLQDYRKLVGLSRAAMAARIGTTGVTIYRWETGRMAPSPAAIQRVRTATHNAVTADDMLAPYNERKS